MTERRRRRQAEDSVYLQNTRLQAQLSPLDFSGSDYYDFVLGDNRTYSGIYNKPLKSDTGWVNF